MFQNTGVMLEMADYAARNSDSVDLQLLAALRRDGMQIRICILRAIARFALSAVNESIWINAVRAESAYLEMELRMAELLQLKTPDVLPGFFAVM